MWLDLKDVIEIPGAEKPFEFELKAENLDFPSVKEFLAPPSAKGKVRNSADVLTLYGELRAKMLCVCDRCGGEFESEKVMELEIPLAADMEDEENSDIYPVVNNGIDLEELLETCFILDMETKFLCSEDCKGLCSTCGKNLNLGPCGCKKPTDPRLAVLGQLLDIEE